MQNSFIFYETFITCFHLFHPTGQQQYTTYSFFFLINDKLITIIKIFNKKIIIETYKTHIYVNKS